MMSFQITGSLRRRSIFPAKTAFRFRLFLSSSRFLLLLLFFLLGPDIARPRCRHPVIVIVDLLILIDSSSASSSASRSSSSSALFLFLFLRRLFPSLAGGVQARRRMLAAGRRSGEKIGVGSRRSNGKERIYMGEAWILDTFCPYYAQQILFLSVPQVPFLAI